MTGTGLRDGDCFTVKVQLEINYIIRVISACKTVKSLSFPESAGAADAAGEKGS